MNQNPNIHFLSAECYPAAKTGGLADVVGALPKYLNKLGASVFVFMPKYDMKWFRDKQYSEEYRSTLQLGRKYYNYVIEQYVGDELGFSLYVIDIPGLFDRDGVYADSKSGYFFQDETERNLAFQIAYLEFVKTWAVLPDVIHNHDHHVGLIPFMMKYCPAYQRLKTIPTVFTIHNQAYQGSFSWSKKDLLPYFDPWKSGELDWADRINPLASSVKCAWKVTTVSPSYMQELKYNSYGLEWLFNSEAYKSVGILNGIDDDVWNPSADEFLDHKFKKNISSFKMANKKQLLEGSQLDVKVPLVAFIGRFASEKGADLLPGIMDTAINAGVPLNFLILGTGDKGVERNIAYLTQKHPSRVVSFISYNESLSHKIYAGADFILMPSRVEPCGLNQMYALRYGTIPIVHNLGGLKDSVLDMGYKNGNGIKFPNLSLHEIGTALGRAAGLYSDAEKLDEVRQNAMAIDYSWTKSAQEYLDIYNSLLS